MRQELKLLCVFLGTLACAPASVPGDAVARAGRAALECKSKQVEVTAGDLTRSSAAMLAASSPAGAALWRGLEEAARPLGAERGHGELNGHSPLNHAGTLTSGFDVCFDQDCGAVPKKDPILLFGCQHGSCSSKAALLVRRNGRLLAVSTTDFKGSKLEWVTRAILSNRQPDVADGADLAVFVEPQDLPGAEILRLMAAWFVLEHHFVDHGVAGNQAAPRRIAELPASWRRKVSVRECPLG